MQGGPPGPALSFLKPTSLGSPALQQDHHDSDDVYTSGATPSRRPSAQLRGFHELLRRLGPGTDCIATVDALLVSDELNRLGSGQAR